jgi:RNA polymerase sigma factor (sigma-70 family)
MLASVPRSEAEQDRHLVELYEMLRKFAPEHIRGDRVDDAVHETAARVFEKLRAGTWVYPETLDEPFVRKLLINQDRSRARKERRGRARDAEHLRARELTPPAWMSADQCYTEEWIRDFQEKAIEKLPVRCQEAFRLVRDQGCSHAEIAVLLDASVNTICNDLVAARKAIRTAAEAKGILPETRSNTGKTQRRRRKRKYTRFAPKYPAAEGATHEHLHLVHNP